MGEGKREVGEKGRVFGGKIRKMREEKEGKGKRGQGRGGKVREGWRERGKMRRIGGKDEEIGDGRGGKKGKEML